MRVAYHKTAMPLTLTEAQVAEYREQGFTAPSRS
jgi:hypothetical protein